MVCAESAPYVAGKLAVLEERIAAMTEVRDRLDALLGASLGEPGA